MEMINDRAASKLPPALRRAQLRADARRPSRAHTGTRSLWRLYGL